MSIKRLTDDERATYSLGLAVRRQLEEARDEFAFASSPPKFDPKLQKVFDTIFRWTKRWLTPDEVDEISVSTGYLIRKEFQNEMLCEESPRRPSAATSPINPMTSLFDERP